MMKTLINADQTSMSYEGEVKYTNEDFTPLGNTVEDVVEELQEKFPGWLAIMSTARAAEVYKNGDVSRVFFTKTLSGETVTINR